MHNKDHLTTKKKFIKLGKKSCINMLSIKVHNLSTALTKPNQIVSFFPTINVNKSLRICNYALISMYLQNGKALERLLWDFEL